MNARAQYLIAVVATLLVSWTANAAMNSVVNISGNPNVFECTLTAEELDVKIVTTNGSILVTNTVRAMVYKDENNVNWPQGTGIPVPVMNLTTGQMVICHFKNELSAMDVPDGASIHWHGIELDNDSDGTGVTQDSVLEGQSYTYRFIVPRPGLFWFHSHMEPADTSFAGMYGVIIIPNSDEGTLINDGVLPTSGFTYPLAMSDIEYTSNVFTNPDGTFIASGTPGRISADGTTFMTMNQWALACHNSQDQTTCQTSLRAGKVVLVNGEHPLATTGAQTPIFNVPRNKNIRLQLLNEALTRNFRLKLINASGQQIKLLHIGGQGGLLDKARFEGGTLGTWDSKYTQGEVVIGSGDRIDVLAFASGNNGDILTLVGNPLGSPFNLDGPMLGPVPNIPNNYPLAYFKLTNVDAGETATANGAPILAFLGDSVEQLGAVTGTLVDPAPLGLPGTKNQTITLQQPGQAPSIDGIQAGVLDGNTGDGAFLTVPRTNNDRYAYLGDLIQLSIDNRTSIAHPFHWHGFSFQPVSIMDDNNSNILYTFNYNDFVDTMNIYSNQTLVFKVRFDDRPKFCDDSPSFPPGPVVKPCSDSTCGGALGRWLYHCHIFSHAGSGMISEFTILPNVSSFTNQSKAIQHPDISPTGVGVLATAGTGSPIVADDFLCTASGPITAISVWGSWLNDIVDPNTTFELKFWTDIPSSPSTPGVPLWRQVFPPGTYSNSLAGITPSESFYDPSHNFPPGNDTQVYQYNFSIPQCGAFVQNAGNVYWLSVTAYPTLSNALFGWKTCITNDAYGDDSTWGPTTNYPSAWTDLHYPPLNPFQGISMDQAFALTTTVATNCSTPVVASFSGSPTSGAAPLPVSFTDSSTGAITNRFWNFGDGNTTNVTTAGVSHTYTTVGNYSVTLTVIGPCGSNTIALTNYITVTPGCSPPTVIFSGSPTNGSAALTVLFNDTVTGSVTNRFWNFGDGSTTNVPAPGVSHTYTNAGTYTVTLVVSGPCGTNTLTRVNYITLFTALQSWQIQYFGSTNNPNAAPGIDLFGTGMSNTNKFLTGFSPTNPAVYLRIINIVKTNNNVNVIYLGPNGDNTWSPGIASRTNVLDFTTGTANGSYVSNNFASTGQTNILSGGTGLGLVTNMLDIGGATNVPSRYYRIRVLVP